jgi:hypothetical protein
LPQKPAASSTNAARLASQLTEQETRAVFTSSGALQPEVIANSTEIINGTQLGNQALVKSLTADGSNIADLGKYTTQTLKSPSWPFQVHFYYNSSTDHTYYVLGTGAAGLGAAVLVHNSGCGITVPCQLSWTVSSVFRS